MRFELSAILRRDNGLELVATYVLMRLADTELIMPVILTSAEEGWFSQLNDAQRR